MKKIIKILVALFPFYTLSTFASASTFQVILTPEKVKVGEAVDLTIKAVDDTGKVDTSYVGEIIIMSDSDQNAEFPGIKNNSYKFESKDAGVVKFENAVKFSKKGIMDVTVGDLANDDFTGIGKVEVVDGSSIESTGEISIDTPENGITIPTKEVEVSGTTNKNSKVQIKLNDKIVGDVISNSGGIFTYNLRDLTGSNQKLQAILLDSDEKEISKSPEVNFKIQASGPEFKSIELEPNSRVEGLTVVNVKVLATPGLSQVQIVINDTLETLKETSPGEYSGSFTSPKDNGEYPIDVNLKDSLGLSLNKKDVIKLTVKNIELLAPVQENTKEEVKINCDDFKKELVIKNIKLVKMKSKSILSWDKVDKATSYNVYKIDSDKKEVLFQNVTDNKIELEISGDKLVYEDFVIKAVFKDDVCNVEGEVSQTTKVQTGPTEILIIVISIILASILYLYKRRKTL